MNHGLPDKSVSSELMITAIHHGQITIPPGGESEARAFYCGLLGLAEIAKPESLAGRGGFWLAVGERSVHVGVEEGVDRSRTKAHVAYEVADLAAMRQKLTAAGVEVIEGIPIPGHDRLELRDPFGNRLELIQPHAPVLPPAALIEIPECITTERLEIRQPRLERLEQDAAEVHAAVMESIVELQQWMRWAHPVPTLAATRDNLRRAIEQWRMRKELRLLLFLKDIPRFEIGYWARTSFAGHGYITEAVRAIHDTAFDTLAARRVEIRTSSDNPRSRGVAERAGFPLEAVLKEDYRQIDGALRDTCIYAEVRGVSGRDT